MNQENQFNEGKMYLFHPDDNTPINESLSINTLLKLDKILERLQDDKPPGKSIKELTDWVNKIYKLNLDTGNTSLALQKMMKEGYVTDWIREVTDGGTLKKTMKTDYLITFDGVIFYNNGGYTQKSKDEANRWLLHLINIWIVALGTGLGGLYVLVKGILWLYGY